MWTLQTFLRRLIWVCMAPLLFLALLSVGVNLRQSRAHQASDLEQRASLARQDIDLKLGAQALGLRMLAASRHLQDPGPPQEFYREAQAFHATFGAHVVLADRSRMLMNTRVPLGSALPAMPQIQGRSALAEALATGRVAVGDLFEGPISKTPLLAMAVPLAAVATDGQVLMALFEAAQWEQELRSMPLPEGVWALLLDSTGRPITAPGAIDTQVSPSLFGQRVVLPLSASPWSLVMEADGAAQRALFLEDAGLWLTALPLAAGVAYLAARRAGQRLEAGVQSLALDGPLPKGRGEIAEIARTRERLHQLHRQRDEKEAELRTLLVQLGQAQELERKRIALDLHDDLQQTLASLKMSAAALRRTDQSDQSNESDQQTLRRDLAWSIEQEADQAVQSTRRIIDDLRPQVLDQLGLAAALERLVAREGRETGLQASFVASGEGGAEVEIEPGLAITLYRVAQEALNNVRKHAQAQAVAVQLQQGADGQVVLCVADDGRGLPPPPGAGAGLGLAGMRERMRAVGGTLELRPAEGGGTEVVATVPPHSGLAT